ncbi:hypothetical protein GXP67_18845 [Rhodocytophaga rosea]|uniref:Uncharacterized protein n=1 Tax=Rhodocytophaga rosea TaxID=2704465 RepID=A0A6C0GKM6_9BACT|nr:hypothetical protein [Rhodocytophaga rosea]QHT68555.1 hypothetical protein GXP67_18845 [Rhodocytophaga rosea]
MKILYTSVLFVMGLFSSSDWFEIGPHTSAASTKEHVCRKARDERKIVLIVEEVCPMSVSKTKSYGLFAKMQEIETHPITYKVLWPLTSDQTSIQLSGKAADTILISINSSGHNDIHHRIGLPGKIMIQLVE